MNYFVCNAFTSVPFTGNPATVCVPVKSTAAFLTAKHMQRLAGELSSVETAFVLPPTEPKTDFSLRFFTKNTENPFCGHATIAAAHILSSEYGFRSDEFHFTTRSGLVVVKRRNGKFYELNLRPSVPTRLILSSNKDTTSAPVVDKLLTALRFTRHSLTSKERKASVAAAVSTQIDGGGADSLIPLREVKDHLLGVFYHKPSKNVIMLFDSAWVVTAAAPNPTDLMAAAPPRTNKVTITAVPHDGIVSANSTVVAPTRTTTNTNTATTAVDEDIIANEAVEAKWRKYDFVTRLFAPWFGINEDAVSGASHAILAKLWRENSDKIRQKRALCCYQPGRRGGGEVLLAIHDSERVGVSGEAVTIAHGTTAFVQSHL